MSTIKDTWLFFLITVSVTFCQLFGDFDDPAATGFNDGMNAPVITAALSVSLVSNKRETTNREKTAFQYECLNWKNLFRKIKNNRY